MIAHLRMVGINRLYKYFQAFSLDIVLGSVVLCLFIARLAEVDVGIFAILVLALSTWIIYTFDHLIDVSKSQDLKSSIRHQMHAKHLINIWGAWSFILIIDISLLWKLPHNLIIGGFVLSAIILIYFLTINLRQGEKTYHKEIIGAILYVGGVSLPVFFNIDFEMEIWFLALIAQLVLLAFFNLLIISIYESNFDLRNNFQSLALAVGKKRVDKLVTIFLCLMILSSLVVILMPDVLLKWQKAQLIILIMSSMLLIVHRFPRRFEKANNYRAIADFIFLLPIIYSFWE